MPDLIPLRDAALEFAVNEATLYRAIRRGRLQRWKRELDRAELRRLLEFKPAPRKP